MSNRKTILLVDNNRTSSLYLGIILKRMGFKVEYAETGTDALDMVKQARPDIILMDAELTAPSGTETLVTMRKDPALTSLPVIMLSAVMDEGLIRRCALSGSNGVLSRPVRMDELHDMLQKFVFSISGIRRRYMRVNARIKAMLLFEGSSHQFITEALSEGGLYLRSDNPYPVGSDVIVSLPAPGHDLKVKGKVIYHRGMFEDNTSVPPGMAVEFHGLTDDETAALRLLISGLMTGDMGVESDGVVRRNIFEGKSALNSQQGTA